MMGPAAQALIVQAHYDFGGYADSGPRVPPDTGSSLVAVALQPGHRPRHSTRRRQIMSGPLFSYKITRQFGQRDQLR
jgi:hypothetical protein